jgi:hypothetical protein
MPTLPPPNLAILADTLPFANHATHTTLLGDLAVADAQQDQGNNVVFLSVEVCRMVAL